MAGNFGQGKGLIWSSDPAIAGGMVAQPAAEVFLTAGNSSPSPLLDVSGYRELFVEIILSAFTGTNITFEWDALDDILPSPTAIPLAKSAALTAPTNLLLLLGAGVPAAAPVITGWTVVTFPGPFGVAGQLKWVPTAVTAATCKILAYGK